MEMSHSLHLKQQQKLVMTPQLQQVIKMLQLPMLELVELVKTEIEANPILEEGEEVVAPELPAKKTEEDEFDGIMDAWVALASDGGPREARDRDREEDQEKMQGNRLVAVPTLEDYLLDQAHLTEASEEDLRLAELIIGNLDDSGYLTASIEELGRIGNASLEDVSRALKLVQLLDPPGIGARNLKECLLLQLRESTSDSTLARKIVGDHLNRLDGLSGAGMQALAADLGEDIGRVKAAIEQIRALDPKPARQFAQAPPTVIPDARLEKVGGDYVVVLNEDGLPPLRLSQSYRDLLSRRDSLTVEERTYLKERFRSALMLMKGIEQRRVTLHKVLERIVDTQRPFLEKGPMELKPLTLKEVADAVGVHESTVSRVVANKYIQTPQGLRPLRDFFSNRLPGVFGEGTSGVAVREHIRNLIEAEDRLLPLSDEKLVNALNQEGIRIARRTVTKYREAMNLPAAWQRRANGRAESRPG